MTKKEEGRGHGEPAQGARRGPGRVHRRCSINAVSETLPAQRARATVTPAGLTQGQQGTWWGRQAE